MSSKEAKPLKMTTKKVGFSGKPVYDYPDTGKEAKGTPRLRDLVRVESPKLKVKRKKKRKVSKDGKVTKSDEFNPNMREFSMSERKDYWVWKLSKGLTPDPAKEKTKEAGGYTDDIDQGMSQTGPMPNKRGTSMGSEAVENPKVDPGFYGTETSDEDKKKLKEKNKEMAYKSLGLGYINTPNGVLPGQLFQFDGSESGFAIVKSDSGCFTVNIESFKKSEAPIQKSVNPGVQPTAPANYFGKSVQEMQNSMVSDVHSGYPDLTMGPTVDNSDYERRLGAMLGEMGAKPEQKAPEYDSFRQYDLAVMNEHRMALQAAATPIVDLGKKS